ncbi:MULTISPECIES: tetratricopeptide repeat protein [unclassified Campylobacter]|uniref:tetratricopeptide repeat protein n=1 Tax=unclassified Campylobacter TaxID=2593542 RepID=UPI001D84EABF|nr:tetratricopeptide repeat protein [Campylobacter sp. RM9331]MBZ8005041.1 tetratricopeptide repeat protein [Campylobacter sp. RM9332]
MAEEQVIVIEEGNTLPVKQSKFSKKSIILIAGLSLLIIILLVVLLFLIFTQDKSKEIKVEQNELIEPKISIQQFKSQKLDLMVAKANALYESGNKSEALKIYENIAKYNESFSHYNLGVSRMKQANYKGALESFQKALENNENNTVAALNAAVCALKLQKDKEFKYYIDLAYSYLSNEKNSSLYYYYLGLVNFYKGFYPEALQALNKQIHPLYQNDARYLRAKILSSFNKSSDSIREINLQDSYDKNLSLGLLYARNAEYNKARFYLKNALEKRIKPKETKLALALVDIKLAEYQEASRFLKELEKNDLEWLKSSYNVKTTIDDRIFDINYAQHTYEKTFIDSKQQKYDLIFYFSPFKVFDATSATKMINKANVNIYLDDLDKSSNYLKNSQTLSKINIQITKALNYAFSYDIKSASELLEELVKLYPQHSILQYDLGLAYALLGKYDLAKKHFLASYHLDPKDLRAGIYALFCSDLLYDDTTKLEQDLQYNLNYVEDEKDRNYYLALFSIKKKDYVNMQGFLNQTNTNNISNISLEILGFYMQNDYDKMIDKSKVLIDLSDNDIIANILYFSLKNNKKDVKAYAKDVQMYFLNKKLDYRSLFGGAKIVGYNYVKLMQISGLLQQEREKLKQYLKTNEDIGALKALAYIDIYANEFEESFAIYNSLIDDYHIEDSDILFLASVAAIGAGHNNSAIALLELSRVKNPSNLESRLALALLYHEAKNYESAISQYEKMNDEYKSEFFTFQIFR